jgi:tRNA nucleotidyltransferase (CCA-adding enzyme)
VIDVVDGVADVEAGQIRALHERSFQDDATRILRAVRYAGRFCFAIDRRTQAWLRRDLSFLREISGARLRREIELIASEDCVAPIVGHAQRLGVWEALDRAMRSPKASVVSRVTEVPPALRDAVLIAVLLSEANALARRRAIERLALTRAQRDAVDGLHTLRRRRHTLSARATTPSRIANVLETVPLAAVEALAVIEGPSLAGRRARRYLDEWRHVRVRLRGDEVIALGVHRGPRVGEMLGALRDARLDGVVRSKRDEEEFVRAHAKFAAKHAR